MRVKVLTLENTISRIAQPTGQNWQTLQPSPRVIKCYLPCQDQTGAPLAPECVLAALAELAPGGQGPLPKWGS